MTSNDREETEDIRAKQQLANALLAGLHEVPGERERRIEATLNRFRAEQGRQPEVGTRPPRSRALIRWFSVAAAVLIAGYCWNAFLQPATLDAAVERVEWAAIQPVTRVYDIVFTAESRGGGNFRRRARMLTRSTDQFLVRMDDLPKRTTVFGTDGDTEWFIVGNRYGTLDEVSRNRRPQAFFLEERMHGFMLANRLLNSLSSNYAVEILDESPPREYENCTGLLGLRIDSDRRSPREVRIWADPDSGVARYVRLIWNEPLRFKPKEVELRFVGERQEPDDYFDLDYHVRREQLD